MPATSPSSNGVPPRRGFRARGLSWPLGIVIVLGGTMGLNLWVLRVAGSDPSFAVERDYYAKGVRFDEQVAKDRASRALGWTLSSAVGARATGDRTLEVALADRAGVPVTGATVVVQAFAIARSADVRVDTLVAGDAGRYAARAPLARDGLWELRFDVTRGAERVGAVQRLDVGAAVGAGR
jgi:nitrogen fixation protein FixH